MHVYNQGTKSGMLDCGVVVVDKCMQLADVVVANIF